MTIRVGDTVKIIDTSLLGSFYGPLICPYVVIDRAIEEPDMSVCYEASVEFLQGTTIQYISDHRVEEIEQL